MSFIETARNYLKDSVSELRKVTWPTKHQMIELSVIVIVITGLVTLYVAVLDGLLSAGYEKLLTFLS